jgi:hypothetical protein
VEDASSVPHISEIKGYVFDFIFWLGFFGSLGWITYLGNAGVSKPLDDIVIGLMKANQ